MFLQRCQFRRPFAEYVNMFLKLKQESSEYLSWVQSEEDKDKYTENYRRVKEIVLDKASVFKNTGKGISQNRN